MRVLVAGATGVIGNRLVPLLTSVGHDVVALVRSSGRVADTERTGAQAVVANLLDRSAVLRAVDESKPDAIVHMATAIPHEINPRKMTRDFAVTNRLRVEGTRNLVEAAERARVRRLVTQGVAFAYQPTGQGPANEDTPFWPNPPRQFVLVLDAVREMERLTAQANGLVLRFGHLYGPGSVYAADGSFVRQVRAGKVPIVGKGTGTFSFTHAHDAASAVVAALDKDATGAFNVVDDEPAELREWLPGLARILGAREPRHLPMALVRLAAGGWGAAFLGRLRGADNARARLALDWRPRYSSWREGFVAELGGGSTG